MQCRLVPPIVVFILAMASACVAGMPVPGRVGVLLKSLESKDPEARLAALEELAELGPSAAAAAPAVALLLGNRDEDVSLHAAITLGKIGKEAVAPVLKRLDGADTDATYYALAALAWMGSTAQAAEPQVMKALGDKNDLVRAKAAFALGRIGVDPKTAIGPLLKLLTDKSDAVRRSAGDALGQFKAAAVPALIEALQDDWITIRLEAARALGQIGPEARDAAGSFKAAILDASNELAETALAALIKIGPAAVTAYREACEHERGDVRQRAFLVLEKAGAPAAPFLAEALRAKSVEARREAARVLTVMGLKEDVLVPALARALADKDREVRRLSLSALMHVAVGARSAVPAVLEVLKEKDAEMKIAALSLLREIPEESEAIVRAVRPLLRDDNDAIRRLANEVLAFQGKIGDDAR